MYKILKYPLLLLFASISIGCNSDKSEEKSIESAKPELENQPDRDAAKLDMRDEKNTDLYLHYRKTTEEFEKSSDYSAGEIFKGSLAPLKENSHPNARDYIIALRQGMTKGINFAGKYTVVSVDCGNNCQEHFIVDREDGKIIENIKGSAGAKYNPDSRLFILNPPESTIDYTNCKGCVPQLYQLHKGKLNRMHLDL